jgi:hypothetical protein
MRKITLEELKQPDHGAPFDPAAGAYMRASDPHRMCVCDECQAAHRRANRTPESPLCQGQIVKTPGGLGVVYQTNADDTRVDLAGQALLYVVRYPTAWCEPVEQ